MTKIFWNIEKTSKLNKKIAKENKNLNTIPLPITMQ